MAARLTGCLVLLALTASAAAAILPVPDGDGLAVVIVATEMPAIQGIDLLGPDGLFDQADAAGLLDDAIPLIPAETSSTPLATPSLSTPLSLAAIQTALPAGPANAPVSLPDVPLDQAGAAKGPAVAAVPESGTLLLLAGGALLISCPRRRWRRA